MIPYDQNLLAEIPITNHIKSIFNEFALAFGILFKYQFLSISYDDDYKSYKNARHT